MDSPGELRIHATVCVAEIALFKSKAKKSIIPFGALKAAANYVCGVDVDDPVKKRKREKVEGRTLISVYLQANTTNSLAKIGIMTGGRDHASVLADKRRFNNLMFSNLNFKRLVELFFKFLEIDFPPEKYSYNMNVPQKKTGPCKN